MTTRAKKTETLWLSLYRETDAVIARAMADEGKLHLIDAEHCPSSHAVNAEGFALLCAIALPAEHRDEYNERCAQLRA